MSKTSCWNTSGKQTRLWPFTFYGLCMIVFGGGCEQSQPPVAAPPPVVEVAEVIQQDVPVHQEWVGILDGMVNAQITAQVTGYLTKQVYREGSLVRKGDLLYQIDARTFQAKLAEARGNLARQEALLKTARLDLQRIQRLLPERAVSVRDRDTALGRVAQTEAEVLVAVAAVEKAKLELGFTRIESPIDGIAGLSKAQMGNLVGPGNANAVLTTVSQVDPIKAFIPLSERQYLQVARTKQDGAAPPQPSALQLILADGSTYPESGRFYFADREVDARTGTIQVAVVFANPGNILRPGQFARIRAVSTKYGALLVPQRAVMETQGKFLVAAVVAGNKVDIRAVKPGERSGEFWVIEAGLQPGERVVVEGAQKLRPGMSVNPRPYANAQIAERSAG